MKDIKPGLIASSSYNDLFEKKERSDSRNYMLAVGTDKGKVLGYQWRKKAQPIFKTLAGHSYGAITAVQIQQKGEMVIAATETGEIIQYELLSKVNEEEDEENHKK